MKEDIRDGSDEDSAHRQYTFSATERTKFREDADTLLRLRKKIEAEITMLFPFYIKGTDLQKRMLVTMREEMMKRLGPGHEKLKVCFDLTSCSSI